MRQRGGESVLTSTIGNSRSDPLDLGGARAIVTGAASGIGRGIAAGLQAHGARVAGADIHLDAASRVASQWSGSVALQVDVTSESSIQAMVEAVAQQWDSVDILVNCAGII